MISFVPKFNKAQIQQILKDKREAIEQAIILRLKMIGERFVINARQNGAYKDRTGNLRNSIGYVILKDGVQIATSFPGNKKDGRRKAQEAAEEAIKNLSGKKGFVLIGVAGMEYAAAVESKGFDVLTGSSKTAEKDLKAAIIQIQAKIRA